MYLHTCSNLNKQCLLFFKCNNHFPFYFRYWHGRKKCPNCQHKWTDELTGLFDLRKVRIDKVRLGQARLGQFRLAQVSLGQVSLGKVRLGKDRKRQVRIGQVKLGQVRLGQVRLGQVRLGQVRLGQVRLGQANERLFYFCCFNFRSISSGSIGTKDHLNGSSNC